MFNIIFNQKNQQDNRQDSSVNTHVKLISQVTKLQASENTLKKTLESERQRIQLLNEQLFQLNQKLYESELNDSLDSPKLNEALHIRIETKHTLHDQTNRMNNNNADHNGTKVIIIICLKLHFIFRTIKIRVKNINFKFIFIIISIYIYI